jgi:hypothetical protein
MQTELDYRRSFPGMQANFNTRLWVLRQKGLTSYGFAPREGNTALGRKTKRAGKDRNLSRGLALEVVRWRARAAIWDF